MRASSSFLPLTITQIELTPSIFAQTRALVLTTPFQVAAGEKVQADLVRPIFPPSFPSFCSSDRLIP
jgi:hypothetical protein